MKTNYSKAGIDKDSVTKRVLIELRRKIIQGVYPSGSRLLETELAAAFETKPRHNSQYHAGALGRGTCGVPRFRRLRCDRYQ